MKPVLSSDVREFQFNTSRGEYGIVELVKRETRLEVWLDFDDLGVLTTGELRSFIAFLEGVAREAGI
jgi:hypothetical protein